MLAIDPRQVLLEARKRAGLSQKLLAERADTAQSVVARIENGKHQPNLLTLQRLVAAAGFDLSLQLIPAAADDAVADAYKQGVDRTQLRESLKHSAAARLRALSALAGLADEARGARMVRRKR